MHDEQPKGYEILAPDQQHRDPEQSEDCEDGDKWFVGKVETKEVEDPNENAVAICPGSRCCCQKRGESEAQQDGCPPGSGEDRDDPRGDGGLDYSTAGSIEP